MYGIEGALSGISIIIATIFIISVTSIADYVKDKRFVQLQSMIADELITVIRGKFGVTQSVNMWNLVVGDVILMQTGERVPADCIVIDQTDLEV
jgi:P-type E1-E2 ATPase